MILNFLCFSLHFMSFQSITKILSINFNYLNIAEVSKVKLILSPSPSSCIVSCPRWSLLTIHILIICIEMYKHACS